MSQMEVFALFVSNTFNSLYANMWNVELISNTFNPLYANMWNVELLHT